MAGKDALKGAQKEASKEGRKKGRRRLRRSVRKTFGALFLASAIAVAAIPTDNLQVQAAEESTMLTWEKDIGSSSVIPLVPEDFTDIYSTEDGKFLYAWYSKTGSADHIAIILHYDGSQLPGNALVIPDTVDAYARYNPNDGSANGYVAVNRDGDPLYYRVLVSDAVTSGGNIVEEAVYEYIPCFNSTRSTWGYTDANKTVERDLNNFWYKGTDGEYHQTNQDTNKQWVRNITVSYIGNQYLVPEYGDPSTPNIATGWKVASADANTVANNGIFANKSNIASLTIGENLLGIGNYAFYHCTSLTSITLSNGIEEIGHHAFDDCAGLTSVNIPFASNLQYISDYAFSRCRALKSFQLSSGVGKIFDHAFDGCTALTDLKLNGLSEDQPTTLNEIGYYAFNGCSALADVVLPVSLTNANQGNALHLNNFAGCSSLKRIQVDNPNLNLTADSGSDVNFTVEDFKAQVDSTFYFEANGTSNTHNFTQGNVIAFKYKGEDRYEIVMLEDPADANLPGVTKPEKSKLIYQVNSQNELLSFNMDYPVDEVTIPTTIGPYGVSAINAGSFSNNTGSCYLKKITIPGTVKSIGASAFEGCHNLNAVIFLDAAQVTSVDASAFRTQVVTSHSSGCDQAFDTPVLSFTGEVGSDIAPFAYAMDKDNYISNSSQTPTYITYYSGWPSNLEIRYVYDDPAHLENGAATLVDYPRWDDLGLGSRYTRANYPYFTEEYEEAFRNAQTGTSGAEVAIANVALNVSVPEGVKMIADGLFSGVTAVKKDDGTYETDEDGTYKAIPVAGQSADTYVQTVTFADIDEFEPYTFSGCNSLTTINITGGKAALDDYAFASKPYKSASGGDGAGVSLSKLTTVNMEGGGSSIGNYAFDNNAQLRNVKLSNAVSSLGLRPFRDCPLLNNVDFSGGEYFTTDRAIIYELSDGQKSAIVQCLESRGTVNGGGTNPAVNANEVTGVTRMYPEAFMNSDISTVDLSSTKITSIPEYAFAGTGQINVTLPEGCEEILEYAFHNSDVRTVDIPRSVTFIDPAAFNTDKNPRTDGKPLSLITFYCNEGSAAYRYASNYDNINPDTNRPDTTRYTVSFYDYTDPGDKSTVFWVKDDDVMSGGTATPPDDPEPKEGWEFTGWYPGYSDVRSSFNCYAQYERLGDNFYKIIYHDDDDDGTVLYEQEYREGARTALPQNPTKEGKIFQGWVPAVPERATSNLDVYARWRDALEGEDDGTGGSGSGTGGSGNGTGGSGNGTDGSGSPGASGGSGTLYTLTVQNGSGSGSYAEGSQPVIIANNPAAGQVFDYWSVSPEDVKIASTVLSASIITMPAKDVTVTAHYKAGSGSGTSGSGSTGSGNNTQRPNGSIESVSNGGTTVVIDKNGISNTGVVSATVHGSSDNFVIKITETNEATEAALRALAAEYGSLENIRYFPMDISLYDSTGTYKITDTTGITVDITLPLPDSLITYAGNNKVASIVNDRLESLASSTRFSTIQGVSCVTFTAEHFSPYMIYVDLGNLSSGLASDTTPKTGDAIHPKWFLSIGLACLSFVFFMQRDTRKPKKVKVRV